MLSYMKCGKTECEKPRLLEKAFCEEHAAARARDSAAAHQSEDTPRRMSCGISQQWQPIIHAFEDGTVLRFELAERGTTPPPSTAEFEPLLRGELKHGRSCPAVGAPMDEGSCDCGLKWRIRLQTEMTLRNAWEKRAYEAEAALAAAEPPRGKVSVLAPPDPRKDLAALENAIGWAESGKVPVKAVVDSWREALAEMRGAKR